MPWRTITGDELAPRGEWELEVLVKGIFEPGRFLDLVHNFIVFEVDGPAIAKKMAAYHQFHAVRKAVASTVDAASAGGDRRAGVVWHTQGAGKSLSTCATRCPTPPSSASRARRSRRSIRAPPPCSATTSTSTRRCPGRG